MEGTAHSPGLVVVLTLAMALPMLVLYAIGALGPQLVTDLGVRPDELGALPAGAFAVAAVLSLWSGRIVDRMGTRGAARHCSSSSPSRLPRWRSPVASGCSSSPSRRAGSLRPWPTRSPTGSSPIGYPPKPGARWSGSSSPGCNSPPWSPASGCHPWLRCGGGRLPSAWVPPVALVCLIATLRLPHAAGGPGIGGAPLRLAAPGRVLAWLLALQLCLGAGLAAVTTFVPLYAHQDLGASERHGALVLAGFGVSGMVSRVLWTSVAGRRDDPSGLQLMLTLLAAIAAGALWLSSVVPAGGLALVWAGALGVGATAVAANAVSMLSVINDRRFGSVGHASALASSGFFAGFVVGPPLAGLLADTAGFGGTWVLAIGAFLLATGCAAALQRLGHTTVAAPAP